MLPLILVAIFFATCIALIVYARWNYGVLESLNIPVLKPHWLLGSLPDLHKKVQQLEDIERFKKFGPIYGLYEGRNPQIFISDPEIIRLIFVKDYEYFKERADIDLGHAVSNNILDYLPFDTWKHVRSIWTHALSAGRIKHMSTDIQKLSDEFVKDLIDECDGRSMKFDIRGRFVVVLADIITSSLFGVQMENRKDPNNQIITLMREVLCENVRYNSTYNLTLVFPFLRKFFLPFHSSAPDTFRKLIVSILESRSKDGKHNDIADSLLEMRAKLNTPEFKKLGITETTIVGQALELFFAIYDSTGTAMTLLIHYLTQNPVIQDKLLEEIDSVVEEHGGKMDYDTIGELPYLTACLNETMRLTPPFIRPERVCTKDWEYNGLRIPKGVMVMIPLFAAHRNPEVYSDPETFDPERFLPENKGKLHSYAYSTFGHGPKNCVGMKLAYEMSRMILCRLFKDFRFESKEAKATEIKYKPGTLFFLQYDPIIVNIVPRNNN